MYGFRPTTGPTSFFSLSSAVPLQKKNFFASLYLDYAQNPFSTQNLIGTSTDVVSRLLSFDASVAYGLSDSLTLGLGAPFSPTVWFTQIGDTGASSKMGVGDVKLDLLWAFLPLKNSVGLALEPFVEIPTGSDRLYLSEGAFTGGGNLISEFHLGKTAVAVLNAGVHWKPAVVIGDVPSGAELNAGAGLAFHLGQNWELFGEGMARTLFSDFLGRTASLYEGNAGFHLKMGSSLELITGGGAGFGDGIGAPLFRIFSGLNFQTQISKPPPPLPPPPLEPVIEPEPSPPPPAVQKPVLPPAPRERKFLPIT